MHWNLSFNSPWGYVKEIRWFHFPCLQEKKRKKKKRTAAVIFVGVHKCHGQKLKFIPMTSVHTLSEGVVQWQRIYCADCILQSLQIHTVKTSCFRTIRFITWLSKIFEFWDKVRRNCRCFVFIMDLRLKQFERKFICFLLVCWSKCKIEKLKCNCVKM